MIDINEYKDYENKTIAEFKVAIHDTEQEIKKCLKNKDVKGALEQYKIQLKLRQYLSKKTPIFGKER